MSFKVEEGINQCDKACAGGDPESDTISGHYHQVPTFNEDAPPTLLYEVDYEAAKNSSTSTTMGKSKKKRSKPLIISVVI